MFAGKFSVPKRAEPSAVRQVVDEVPLKSQRTDPSQEALRFVAPETTAASPGVGDFRPKMEFDPGSRLTTIAGGLKRSLSLFHFLSFDRFSST